jgi:hypothetical protein
MKLIQRKFIKKLTLYFLANDSPQGHVYLEEGAGCHEFCFGM